MKTTKKNLIKTVALSLVVCATLPSCENQDVTNIDRDAARIELGYISPEMAKVRDYVPPMAVIAHRGSVYWVPEETEAAWRWAREMGVDYLEADLQCSKDGVILANHDDNLRRTTNIENVFGETVPASRLEFYMSKEGGSMTKAEAEAQMAADRASFNPYYTNQYFYHELAQLDAGTWFNEESMPEQARESFSRIQQYVSPLEDLIMYAEGKKLARTPITNKRIFTYEGTWDPKNPHTSLTYTFQYVDDEQDTGHRPGIYLEFKESWLNPSNFEEMVYNELKELGWNIIEKKAEETEFWKDGKVNVGNTNGKVILQTFSFESLRRTAEKFKGEVPMCFLLWHDNITPSQYAGYIDQALDHKAHIIGPSIAGAPNNYFEMNSPWMHDMIRRAGLLNHPYSFDTLEQMNVYFGAYHYGASDFKAPYMDGAFTNRAEITLQYFIDKGVRDKEAAQTVPDPVEVLKRLGY